MSHKHLTVIISTDLNGKEHTQNVATSAAKYLGVLDLLGNKLDRLTLEHHYQSEILQ